MAANRTAHRLNTAVEERDLILGSWCFPCFATSAAAIGFRPRLAGCRPHGGVGGVGHVGVQLAKSLGARVATTVPSPAAAELARGLGADETINYREEKVAAYVDRLTAGNGFDVVFDTIGGDNLAASFTATAYSGRLATTNARTTQDLTTLHARALSLHVVFVLLPLLRGPGRDRHGRILQAVGKLVDAGKLRPLIDSARFTLETAPDAHRRLEFGQARGKVVIDIG